MTAEDRRQPYMKWYARDWRGDGALRMCGFSARGLWVDLLSLMHDEGHPYGYLRINGAVPTTAQLARMLGGNAREIDHLLSELEQCGVFSRDNDGAIYCRRMIRDKAKEIFDRENGKSGGNPKLKGGVNPKDKAHSQKPIPLPEPTTEEAPAEEIASQTQRIERILGLDENDYIRHVRNIEVMVDLRREGCDFDRHILPAAQAVKSGSAKTVSYIKPRAMQLRDAEKIVKAMPVVVERTDMRGWTDRMAHFRKTNRWLEKWGPKPGDEGCLVPAEILEKAA